MSEDNHLFKRRIDFKNQQEAQYIFGEYDNNIRRLEKKNNVRIFARGTTALIQGSQKKVEQTIKELKECSGKKNEVSKNDCLLNTYSGKAIMPSNNSQKKYIKAMESRDLIVTIGPAGTGKTFLACVQAIRRLRSGEIDKVVLTRPVVEAGEKLGYLPGDLYEKVNPYLNPLYDAFHTLLGPVKSQSYRKDGIIEIVPLAYMRGRTLNNSMIILDEAQNTTSKQMHMFLTRLGSNSKVVITGDITQVDLEGSAVSGLIEIQEVLKEVKGVEFIYFTKSDVIRHPLVKEIVHAYQNFSKDKRIQKH